MYLVGILDSDEIKLGSRNTKTPADFHTNVLRLDTVWRPTDVKVLLLTIIVIINLNLCQK